MKSLVEQLAQYAAYHRDRRNIATHFVGIPMIVAGVATLLGRPAIVLSGLSFSPVALVAAAATIFYLRLDPRFGLAMAVIMGLSVWLAQFLAAQSTGVWLGAVAVLFLGGWVIQLVGHGFEGKKPAFVDDLIGLLIGPLFVVAEASFAFGLRTEVLAEIERRSGPTHSGRRANAPAQ